tara:strand:+ start:331 stop:705 length:375 start_codon:yes stop_codon:yes gene_type:complete
VIFQNILYVALGSVLGSWLRFYLINFSANLWHKKYFGTILVNSIATFLLSISWPLFNKGIETYSSLGLFYIIGFIGSLSTFSTFIIEVLESLFERNWIRSFSMITYSLFISFTVGFIGLKIAST